MTQEALVYIIVGAAVLVAARWFCRSIGNARRGNIRCSGCPLQDSCKGRKPRSCGKAR